MRLIDPNKIPKMGEPTTLEDTPMYEFAQCLVDYLVENYGVDVPDIVCCKDCKHLCVNEYGQWCEGGFVHELSPIENDDFCSRGERKESEE